MQKQPECLVQFSAMIESSIVRRMVLSVREPPGKRYRKVGDQDAKCALENLVGYGSTAKDSPNIPRKSAVTKPEQQYLVWLDHPRAERFN